MSPESKNQYFLRIASRYKQASKNDKFLILHEFCQICDYHRKYAISKLRSFGKPQQKKSAPNKPGRKPQYHHPDFIHALKTIWIATNLICSKRLKFTIPNWIEHYQENHKCLSPEIYQKLIAISPSSIDAALKPIRHQFRGKGRCTTKPGLLLKSQIAIKTKQWDEFRPGYIESDTVAHCGTALAGLFAYTTNSVDIATNWSEQRATLGKGFSEIAAQIKDMEKYLPFPILGFDSDNGGEFINYFLLRYFRHRKTPIDFTRSREYQKNDNAHVEGKNWTHVRQWLGYRRFENPLIVTLLNDLYKTEWRLYHNLFIPSVKLLSKERVASKTIKKHDVPKTPYQRILESKHASEKIKNKLRTLYKTLDPFKLKNAIDKKIARIHQLAQ